METNKISATEIKQWQNEQKDFTLIDVLPSEYYAQKHIVGAKNAPVYEVVFLSHVEKIAPDKKKTLVVYNESPESFSANDAAQKLMRAGYENVYEFPGGLVEWENAGFPVKEGQKIEEAEIADGVYELDQEQSIIKWTGRKAKYAHQGTLKIKNGHIIIKGGLIEQGKIVLDMTTIADSDIAEGAMREVLETHLKSSDFFDVENFPEASFEITGAEKIEGARIDTVNFKMNGNLQIKDIKRPLSVDVQIAPSEEGTLLGQAHFDFDRTLWNVRYGSEKFFEKLGMHVVNNEISLDIFLVAK